jgi:hypothetical protein
VEIIKKPLKQFFDVSSASSSWNAPILIIAQYIKLCVGEKGKPVSNFHKTSGDLNQYLIVSIPLKKTFLYEEVWLHAEARIAS